MKIVGVGKTKQITRAMNMVASAKLRGAQTRIEKFRPYAEKYRSVIGDLAARADQASNALLTPHEEKKNCGILLVTSDRGLCGGFNASIIAEALKLAKERHEAGLKTQFFCVGKKGRDAIRAAGYETKLSITDRMSDIDFMLAVDIGKSLLRPYIAMDLDEVWMVYGEFLSMGHQPPARVQLLPLEPPKVDEASNELVQCDYVYEPGEVQLLDDLLPRYVNVQIYRGLLDTSASEHAARMAAMDNATRNCNEMINTLTLLYNKTRQASITSELIDIVGGAEALKG